MTSDSCWIKIQKKLQKLAYNQGCSPIDTSDNGVALKRILISTVALKELTNATPATVM
jgi:hypothetical protein